MYWVVLASCLSFHQSRSNILFFLFGTEKNFICCLMMVIFRIVDMYQLQSQKKTKYLLQKWFIQLIARQSVIRVAVLQMSTCIDQETCIMLEFLQNQQVKVFFEEDHRDCGFGQPKTRWSALPMLQILFLFALCYPTILNYIMLMQIKLSQAVLFLKNAT